MGINVTSKITQGRSLLDLYKKIASTGQLLQKEGDKTQRDLENSAPIASGVLRAGIAASSFDVTDDPNNPRFLIGRYGDNDTQSLGDPMTSWSGTISEFMKDWRQQHGIPIRADKKGTAHFPSHLAWWYLTSEQKEALAAGRKLGKYLPSGLPPSVPAYFLRVDQGNKIFPSSDGFSGDDYIGKVQQRASAAWSAAVADWWTN